MPDSGRNGSGPRRLHTRYLRAHSFEAALGVAAVIAGLVYVTDPEALRATSIGASTGAYAPAWSALYFFGGLGILGGLISGSLRVELAGLCLFMPAMVFEGIVILAVAGSRGISPAASFVAFTVAAALRARTVLRLALHARDASRQDGR